MTSFADVIQTGNAIALTSGQSSLAPTLHSRTFRFTGGGAQTQTFVLPTGVQNVDAKLYIIQDGSAATSDAITVSAGGVDLINITSFGSTAGLLRNTTAALGTLSTIASACANLSTTAEVSAAATLASTDVGTDYQLVIEFSRLRKFDL